VAHRAEQMALLAGLQHDRATDPRLGELLAAVEGSPLLADPLSAEAVNVREIGRAYVRNTRLPRPLVKELARVTSLAQQQWEIARQRADHEIFHPWLDKIVALQRREAECLGLPVLYDALLDEYEPGLTSREVAGLFEALRRDLAPLVGQIAGARRRPNVTILHREYPIDRQRVFGEAVAAAVGFDFHGGRLDNTVHPFCSGIGLGDCRIATRYSLNNFSDGFFGILHEVGHGLYEQGLDPAHHGTPMGEAASLGMHESQARLWENFVGRGLAFWKHFFPLARQIFHETLQDVTLEEFHFAINCVEP